MKLKKSVKIIILSIIIILAFFVIYSLLNKEYKIQYKLKGHVIKEAYLGNEYYSIESTIDKIQYILKVSTKYLNKKKIISDVKKYRDEQYTCILYESKYTETYPVCVDKNKNNISYTLIETENFKEFYTKKEKQKISKAFKKIDITTLSENILIWNYKGYIYLQKEGNFDIIEFLNKESYYNNNAFQIENYVLTPNYDDKYEFNSFYIFDLQNGKLSKWEMEIALSYNYYLLGVKDGKGYIIDRKSKKEYMINPKKQEIEEISENNIGKIWAGQWKNISITKLIKEEHKFKIDELHYYLKDNKLYCNDTLLSNLPVDQIISSNKDRIYYLVEEKLYGYDPYFGEYMICSYSEWNFNYNNQIFIY